MVLCSIQKASSIFLQSVGKPVPAMILSLARDFVLIAPMCVILPTKLGVVGPLFSAPIADVICFVITLVIMSRTFRAMAGSSRITTSSVSFGKSEAAMM
jgi:Na+-driven multidrug efflux pump